MTDYKRLYEIACKIGETHSREVIKRANEIQRLRRVIWRALNQLRAGHANLARKTLETQIKKDQQDD